MLSAKDLTTLTDILKDEDKSLEVTAASIHKSFVRADHFRVACTLCILLDDNMMSSAQRLSSLFILHDLYRNEQPVMHPFFSFLIDRLISIQDTTTEVAERALLCMILGGTIKDWPKKSPLELERLLPLDEPIAVPKLSTLQRTLAERDSHVPALSRTGIKPLIPITPQGLDGSDTRTSSADEVQPNLANLDGITDDDLTLHSFEPMFVSSPPPLL